MMAHQSKLLWVFFFFFSRYEMETGDLDLCLICGYSLKIVVVVGVGRLGILGSHGFWLGPWVVGCRWF